MELQLTLFTTLVTLSLLTFFIFKLLRISNRKSSTKFPPPGPWKLPIIGSIHHFAGSALLHRALRVLSTRYGPLMHLQLGEISTIIISSPEMAKQVMKTHDLAFADRPSIFTPGVLERAGQTMSTAPYGAYWRQMRKICITELLSPKMVRTFSFIRESEVMELIQSLRSSSGSPVNLSEKACSLTSAITSRAAFGKLFEDQDVVIRNTSSVSPGLSSFPYWAVSPGQTWRYGGSIKEGASLIASFDVSYLFPSLKPLRFFSRAKAKRLVSIQQETDSAIRRIIKEHQETTAITGRGNGEAGREDLVDVLLRHITNSEYLECPITIESIQDVITDMTAGGIDTSSTTIEWAMSEMMRNPKVMEKAQSEVRQLVLNKGDKVMLRETDMQNLKYLKLVVKETLRLHPPVPLLVPRQSREQCELNGYTIPVKTRVVVNAWAIGRDPEYWGDDAESFIPERFRDISLNFTGTDFKYIPFGAGRRICPGMAFGIANVEYPLAQLLYHFDWKLPDGTAPEDLDMTERFGGTCGRKHDLCLVAVPYAPSHA